MVANTNSRKCTGWHLLKNVAENSKTLLAGHVIRHDEVALLWKPDGTNLSGTILLNVMKNLNHCKEIIMSPH